MLFIVFRRTDKFWIVYTITITNKVRIMVNKVTSMFADAFYYLPLFCAMPNGFDSFLVVFQLCLKLVAVLGRLVVETV